MDAERKKELINDYKRTPRAYGVFSVTNLRNGRKLLVAAPDIDARMRRHRLQLTTGGHAVKELQQDWSEIGEDGFEFEVLERIVPDDADADISGDLKVLEELWHEKLQPYGERGYHVKKKP